MLLKAKQPGKFCRAVAFFMLNS